MKILIIDTYYQGFLKNFYSKNPVKKFKSYIEQKRALLNCCFGTSDYYSYNLKKLGVKASDLIVNDGNLQQKWAKEHKISVSVGGLLQKIQSLPYIYKFIGRPDWIQKIALKQIEDFNPDVVYIQDLSILNPDTLRETKRHCRLLVGQIACPLPNEENLKQFDLILTSFPHYVERFRKMGINSEYFKIGFDPRVLNKTKKMTKKYPVSFIGSFSPYHIEGTKLLEKLAERQPLHVWGQGLQYLSATSPLRKHFHGEAWGKDMYKILAQSKIVVNRHISAAENNANNMRLYESTGMGAMLITDKKKNLNDLFRVGKEVVEYSSPKGLIEKIKYYLDHDYEREKIAKAGQRRTLKTHNYGLRMKELIRILNKYLKK